MTVRGEHFQSQILDARRVLGKGVCLLLPFAALLVLELFVLPLDFFTFRIWEAALATPYRYPGGFLPNLVLHKEREYGDRFREIDPRDARPRGVTWFTDAYGWRNRPEVEGRSRYDMVVLGDSNIVGSSLDQRDILTEAVGARSGLTAYSYAIGSDHVSLFFSDPRMVTKAPRLLVVESKVGNWNTDNSYLANFRLLEDGTLDVVDRSAEMAEYLDPGRNFFLERLYSQWTKKAMWHAMKATLRTGFHVESRDGVDRLRGTAAGAGGNGEVGWRSVNWVASSAVVKSLPLRHGEGLAIRATGVNGYWHTEPFRADATDGRITVRFEARNTVVPSRHRLYVFEDGSYRAVGDLSISNRWQAFEIPLKTEPGRRLEMQIDQPDTWQWLEIRRFRIEGAGRHEIPAGEAVPVPVAGWLPAGDACGEGTGDAGDCQRWLTGGKGAYVQTPVLRQQGKAGILVEFEARTEGPSDAFSAVYVFEGPDYRRVAQFAYREHWQSFSLPIVPDSDRPLKIQIDLPDREGALSVRDFRVRPLVTGTRPDERRH